jgi:hypothetical protein
MFTLRRNIAQMGQSGFVMNKPIPFDLVLLQNLSMLKKFVSIFHKINLNSVMKFVVLSYLIM